MAAWCNIWLSVERYTRLFYQPGKREIKEAYVCIGVQASSVTKGWLYPKGWDTVVAYLRSMGYRVLCIDKESYMESLGIEIRCPQGAEDFTGNRSLIERLHMLAYADFFIGLSSGLAWLAHSAGCPVVMIGGFSRYWAEFFTPYRVYNRLVCNGCMNDVRVDWHKWACPRHTKESEHVLECSKKISPHQVIETIERLVQDKRLTRGIS